MAYCSWGLVFRGDRGRGIQIGCWGMHHVVCGFPVFCTTPVQFAVVVFGTARTARRVGQNKSQSKYPKLKFRLLSSHIVVVMIIFCCFCFGFLFFFCTATLQQ